MVLQLCYRSGGTSTEPANKHNKETKTDNKTLKPQSKVKPSKSRELRGGVLYVGCDCEKRNGLQDDCHRSECFGRPPCLTRPPTCGPSAYSNAKHLRKLQNIDYNRSIEQNDMGNEGRKEGKGGEDVKKDGGKITCIPISAIKPVCCIPCKMT